MKKQLVTKAVAVGMCLLSAGAHAESKFSLTDLAPLARQADWYGINNAGAIVGMVDRQLSVYSNGALASFELPYAGGNGIAIKINNSGAITYSDYVFGGTESRRAYLFQNGVAQSVESLYPNVYNGGSYAMAINDSGVVAGVGSHYKGDCTDSYCENWRPWNRAIVYKDGKTIDLGTLGGDTAIATGINNQGVVVGTSDAGSFPPSSVFIYANGTMQALGRDSTEPVTINDASQIIGTSYQRDPTTLAVKYEAWLYDHGNFASLGLAGESNIALDLNNAGQVIGKNKSDSRYWLYWDGKTIDLNTLLSDEDWRITGVIDLNDQGQILATAARPDGGLSYVLLTPDQPPVLLPAVPEPGTYAMLIGGLGVLAAWRPRRQA